jgi:hypothetical protein
VAADEGSKMPAFGVFWNPRHPPFDCRTATFRERRKKIRKWG